MLHAKKYFSMHGMMTPTINSQLSALFSLISHIIFEMPKYSRDEITFVAKVVHNNSKSK